MEQEKVIKPIAVPGAHDLLYKFLKPILESYQKPEILEVGAGHGAFTQKLWNEGYAVSACDLFPEIFYFDKVICKKVDISKELPYPNDSFDIVLAIEVMEHIHDHNLFFRECHRILKKGGLFIFSTPNILSLKSRIRFLFTGFYYSFKPLDHANLDGMQHISSLTVDQYNNLAIINGLTPQRIGFDKQQTTSKLYIPLIPLIWIVSKVKSIPYYLHNHFDILTARKLYFIYKKS